MDSTSTTTRTSPRGMVLAIVGGVLFLAAPSAGVDPQCVGIDNPSTDQAALLDATDGDLHVCTPQRYDDGSLIPAGVTFSSCSATLVGEDGAVQTVDLGANHGLGVYLTVSVGAGITGPGAATAQCEGEVSATVAASFPAAIVVPPPTPVPAKRFRPPVLVP